MTGEDLAAIQRRREVPVALVQGGQATIGCRVSRPGLLAAGVAPGLAPPPSAAELALLLSHREGNPPLQLTHLLSD